MNKGMKKIEAIIISILMITSLFPTNAFAGDVCNSSNLKVRWLSSNDYLADASSNGRSANRQGTVNWNSVDGYDCATFSNSDIYYTAPNNMLTLGIFGGVEGGAGSTIAFMANVTSSTSSSPFFCIFNNNYTVSNLKTLFSYAPNGSIVYTNSVGTAKYSSTSAISTGWHTIIIRFISTKTLEIYVDANKVYGEQSDFYDNHTFDVSNTIKVGVNRENTAYYSGSIRDFRVYNTALTVNTLHENLLSLANESALPSVSPNADTSFANLITSSSIKKTFIQPKINGVNIENKASRTYYRNILYCSNSFVANSTATKVNTTNTYGYIVMPSNTIVWYDGVTAPIIPVKASFKSTSNETNGYSYSTFASIWLPSTPAFSLDNTWIGLNTQNCDRTAGWPSDSGSTNQLGTTDVRSGNICQVQSYNYEIGFKNGLVMNSIPSDNPKTNIPFRFNQTVNESSTVTSSGNIYYFDARTLINKVAEVKAQAIDIANNYNKYTTDSYNAYKSKTDALLNFNVSDNLQITLGTSYGLSRLNTAVTNAINEYNTAYSNLKIKEIGELNYLNGTTTTITYAQGESPQLPTTNNPVSNEDGTHSLVVWTKGNSKLVDGITHVEYNQTKATPTSCNYSSQITQNATCTKPQITTYICNECEYTYNIEGEKLEHEIVYDDLTNGTHSGVCSKCHELSTYFTENHSFTNYICNNDATCTANGTKTAKCDKCTATHTIEIPNSALGHSYNATITESTCTSKGYTTYVCSRCNNTYTDNETELKEHNFVHTIFNPTCTEKGYTANICEDCGYTVIDENSYIDEERHNFVSNEIVPASCTSQGLINYTCIKCDISYDEYIEIDPDAHSEFIYARTVAPTDTEDGYDIYYCSYLCGYWQKKNIIASEHSDVFDEYVATYNGALRLIVTDLDPYTDSSISLYNNEILNQKQIAQNAIESRNISMLESATKSIIEANALLRIKSISVSIVVENDVSSLNIEYGDTVTINVSDMSKATITIDDLTTLLCFSDDEISFVATKDSTVDIYKIEGESLQNKITVLDKNGKTIGFIYEDINNLNLNSNTVGNVTAPQIPFYNFASWNIVDDNTIIAQYNI